MRGKRKPGLIAVAAVLAAAILAGTPLTTGAASGSEAAQTSGTQEQAGTEAAQTAGTQEQAGSEAAQTAGTQEQAGSEAAQTAGTQEQAAGEKAGTKASETYQPTERDSVRVHLAGEPGDPVPFKVMDADTASLLKLVSEGLVTLNEEGEPVPGSARKWEVSEDGLVWTFTLRKELFWADGEELTAKDFADLFQKIADPSREALYGGDLTGKIAGYEKVLNGETEALEVKAKGDHTLVVHLQEPDPDFARKCASWALLPVREQLREEQAENAPADWEDVTGNGPYYIESSVPGQEYILKKNPLYHGGSPEEDTSLPFEEIHWMTSGDRNEEYSDFLNGEIDAVAELPVGKDFTESANEIFYEDRVVSDTLGLLFNCRSEILNDPAVRQALAASIDRAYISGEILDDVYVPADMQTLTAFSDADTQDGADTASQHKGQKDGESSPESTSGASAEADLEEARELLQNTDFSKQEKAPVLTCIADENGGALLVAEYLASVWKDLGIKVKVETANAQDLAQEKKAGTFDIICGSLFLASDVPGAELERFVSENEDNVTGFSSDKYDRLLEKAFKKAESGRRGEKLQEAITVLEEEAPLVPLAERRVAWLRQSGTEGIFCDATGCWQLWKMPAGGPPEEITGTQASDAAENKEEAEQAAAESRMGSIKTAGFAAGVLRLLKGEPQTKEKAGTFLAWLRASTVYFEKTNERGFLTEQAWLLETADRQGEKLVSLPKYTEVHLVGKGNEQYVRIEQDGKFLYLEAEKVTADPEKLQEVRAEEKEAALREELLSVSMHPVKESELAAKASDVREETERILAEIAHHEMIKTQTSNPNWDGAVLSRSKGSVRGPSGKETYYNLNMSGVVNIMRGMGNTDEYWVRDDGCKMLGDYIMCAANLRVHPRGSLVESSLGTCIVCDTGGFASGNSQQLDIAVTW